MPCSATISLCDDVLRVALALLQKTPRCHREKRIIFGARILHFRTSVTLYLQLRCHLTSHYRHPISRRVRFRRSRREGDEGSLSPQGSAIPSNKAFGSLPSERVPLSRSSQPLVVTGAREKKRERCGRMREEPDLRDRNIAHTRAMLTSFARKMQPIDPKGDQAPRRRPLRVGKSHPHASPLIRYYASPASSARRSALVITTEVRHLVVPAFACC